MTCGKCGAELNASAKFCASCGTPTAKASAPNLVAAPPSGGPSGTPSAASLLADAAPPGTTPQPPSNLLLLPDLAESTAGTPNSMVNPFAVTASPNLKRPSSKPPPMSNVKIPEPKIETKIDSKPPPKSDAVPPISRAVSPLAVSNGISGPTPFQEALEKARQSVAPTPGSVAPVSAKKNVKKPGTYVMANAPLRPGSKPGSEPPPASAKEDAPPPPKKPVPKTVAMGPVPTTPRSQAQPAPGSVGPGVPQSVGMPQSVGVGMPQSVGMPPQSGMPGSYVAPPMQPPPSMPNQQQQWAQTPQPRGQQPPQPLAPYQAPPVSHQPAPQWGQVPQGYNYGGAPYPAPQAPPGYPPGARVQVTWSNGQRYPATVSQVNGTQCLVRFPDGQQHWVDAQYLTPG